MLSENYLDAYRALVNRSFQMGRLTSTDIVSVLRRSRVPNRDWGQLVYSYKRSISWRSRLKKQYKDSYRLGGGHTDFQLPQEIVDIARQAISYPYLTRQQEEMLFEEMRRGSTAARNQLFECFFRVVVLEVTRVGPVQGFEFGDLIGTGSTLVLNDLAKQTEKEPSQDEIPFSKRYSTYLTSFLCGAVRGKAVGNGTIIRIPTKVCRNAERTVRIYSDLRIKLQRRPSAFELCQAARLSPEELSKSLRIWRQFSTYEDLSTQSDEEWSPSVDHTICDSSHPRDRIAAKQLLDSVASAISTLDWNQRYVLYQRFGFADGKRVPLRQIGSDLRFSRETVRTIERRALDRLRRSIRPHEHASSSIDHAVLGEIHFPDCAPPRNGGLPQLRQRRYPGVESDAEAETISVALARAIEYLRFSREPCTRTEVFCKSGVPPRFRREIQRALEKHPMIEVRGGRTFPVYQWSDHS